MPLEFHIFAADFWKIKVLVILNPNPRRRKPDKEVNTHRRENKQGCHLSHSHRACIQFWNALISLISTFPHSIILGEKKGSHQRWGSTWEILWKSNFFMLAQTQWNMSMSSQRLCGFIYSFCSCSISAYVASAENSRILKWNKRAHKDTLKDYFEKALICNKLNLQWTIYFTYLKIKVLPFYLANAFELI